MELLTPLTSTGLRTEYQRSALLHGCYLVEAHLRQHDLEAAVAAARAATARLPGVQSVRCRTLIRRLRLVDLAAHNPVDSKRLLNEAVELLTPLTSAGLRAEYQRSALLHGCYLVEAHLRQHDLEAAVAAARAATARLPGVQSVRCRTLIRRLRRAFAHWARNPYVADLLPELGGQAPLSLIVDAASERVFAAAPQWVRERGGSDYPIARFEVVGLPSIRCRSDSAR